MKKRLLLFALLSTVFMAAQEETPLAEFYIEITDGVPSATPPNAEFTASSTSILENSTVTFTDTSTNTPISWLWNFPGGSPSTSTAQNPVVTYGPEGTYTVTLTATNTDGSNVETKTDFITVSEASAGNPVITVAATDASATEAGVTTGQWTFTSNVPVPNDLVINIVQTGTADANDFVALPSTVTILSGQTTATLDLIPIDDNLVEGPEIVELAAGAGTGYDVGNPNSAAVNIISEDSNGGELFASVTASDPNASETGADTADFIFSLSAPNNTGNPIVINYHTRGRVTVGTDCNSLSGTISIPDGQQTAMLVVTPNDDGVIEPEETLAVFIDDGLGYNHSQYDWDSITITDNDDVSGSYPTAPTVVHVTTAAEITGGTNSGNTVVIDANINIGGQTLSSDMIIRKGTGQLSGTGINLNGCGIENTFDQLFANNVSFISIYDKSRLSIDMFGASTGDSTNDNTAIVTAINNVQHLTATQNGQYIKNNPTNFTRAGTVDWDVNGAKIEVTSTANFRMASVSVDAVFDFTNLSPTIYNGEFDGNDDYGRMFYFHGQDHIVFKNNHIHDLYAPNAIRCVAFRFTMNINSLDYSEFSNNLIEDVVAQGDGNYNDTHGIAKGFWWNLQSVNNSTDFVALYQNNVMRNIIGDDAEGFYAIGGANATPTDGGFFFENEDYRYCTRRAIKSNVNNVEIRDSYFEEIPETMFDKAQQMGSMIDFFSVSSGYNINDIHLYNNTIRTVPGNNAHYYLLSLTEVSNALIEDNILAMERLHTYGGIRLGSNTSTYNGDLLNVVIRNNILDNTYIQAMQNYNPNNTIDINTNTFNWTQTLGYQIGAFRFYGSGTKGEVDFVDNTVNINMSSLSGVNGVISADPAVTGVVDFNIDNVTITYLNNTSARPFGYIQGNFNSSNTIQNSTLIGDVGTNAVVVTGTGGVQILNSKGDGDTDITEQ